MQREGVDLPQPAVGRVRVARDEPSTDQHEDHRLATQDEGASAWQGHAGERTGHEPSPWWPSSGQRPGVDAGSVPTCLPEGTAVTPMALLESGIPLSLLLDLLCGPQSADLLRQEKEA